MSAMFRIVETDNFGGDYPDEQFVGPHFRSKENADRVAEIINQDVGQDSRRFWKVVPDGYVLAPGFEP